eukprot:GFUD01070679.1.p1 GENE.GFUD01070679.1~~GFUD01070679.1.p1  ORF type:complete len:128 (+),score=23.32 GFUD01070679.1:40-423(+)
MAKKDFKNRVLKNSESAWDLTTQTDRYDSYSDSITSDLSDLQTDSPCSSSSLSGSNSSSPFTERLTSTMNRTSQESSPIDRDLAPRFSGMNLGDVMRITVMKEMDKLKMSNDKPLDLSSKVSDLKKS